MSPLPWTALPPALPRHHGQCGGYAAVSPLQHQALQGGTRANSTWTAAAVLRALPARGNFASHPLKPPYSHCSPSQAKPGGLYYNLLYFPFQKKSHWEFQHFTTLPAGFASLHGKVSGARIPPCMLPCQWLALLPTRMLPGSSRGLQGVQGAIHLLAAD